MDTNTVNRLHNSLGTAWRDLQALLFAPAGLSADQRNTIQRALDQIESVRAEMREESK